MSAIDYTADLHSKIRASFFILLQSCMELKDFDYPHFKDIKDEILAVANNPSVAADLTEQREAVIKGLRELYALKLYSNFTEEWGWHERICKESAEKVNEIRPMDGEDLLSRHMLNLTKNNNENELDSDDLRHMMSLIPLRMTGARYYDYVKDAMGELPFPASPESAEDFKRLFNPRGFLENAEWLDDFTSKLDGIWEQENPEAIPEINDELTKLMAYLTSMFDGVCAAIISLKAREHGIDLLAETKGLSLEDADNLDKATNEALDKIIYDTIAVPDETDAVFDKWLPVHKMFYETSFDYFNYQSRFEEINESDFPGFISVLKEYMENTVKGLSSKRKRFLRQYFMKFIPYPYDYKAYEDYFLDTYKGLDTINRLMLSFYIFADSSEDE